MTEPIDTRQYETEQLRHRASSEANWFFLIVALSIINEVLPRLGLALFFVGGLAATRLAQIFAYNHAGRFGPFATAAGFCLAALAVAVYLVLGLFARKGHIWAWLAGTALYVVDGLACLLYGDRIRAAFHAVILCFLVPGLVAALRARRVRRRMEPVVEPPIEAPPNDKPSGNSLYPGA